MFTLIRLLYRSIFLKNRPLPQIITGLVLIPGGGLLAVAAVSGPFIYPYWVVAGIAAAIFGLVLLVRGITGLLSSRRGTLPTTPTAQTISQPSYGQPSYGQPFPGSGQPGSSPSDSPMR